MGSRTAVFLIACAQVVSATLAPGQPVPASAPAFRAAHLLDSDGDGLPDSFDSCPRLEYAAGFDWAQCGPMDLNPDNDALPECKARERVAKLIFTGGVFVTRISFAVVKDGQVHFADAFEYVGQGQYVHDPAGAYRLYRVGSTSKAVAAVAAKVMEESGELTLADYVDDEDGTQKLEGGERTLRQLLAHLGAFKTDYGAIHLFCYPGDLAAFWSEPDDMVSPHYASEHYGNLGGGYQYSAFNYSLAGAYLAHKAGEPFARLIQSRVFDAAGMCTASFDGPRAVGTAIGSGWGVSQAPVMHVGPYVNFYSQFDPRCEDNFYSSEDLPGDPYQWQFYHADEAAAEARDPAGGVIASTIDLAHFAAALLESYHGPGGIVSPQGIRDIWKATSDLGCGSNCPYQRYYGLGFFTSSASGKTIAEVEHGGSRPGFASAFVIRPEANSAVCILVNADVSTVTLSTVAKAILDDFGP